MSDTILFCLGTRPEAIKLAPLVCATAQRRGRSACLLLDTGQHEPSVLDPLLAFFGLAVDIRLERPQGSTSLTALNARLLGAIGEVLEAHRPDVVVVQGDTATALQGAMAAFLAGIPVAHVEAGLRSGNPYQPFPEEMNRTVIGRLARWHLAPTESAAAALRREQVPGDVHVTGNTIVDAVRLALPRLAAAPPVAGARRLLVTMHRRENWGGGVRRVAIAVRSALEASADLSCDWILHPNPQVASEVRRVLADLPARQAERVQLLPPQPYDAMLALLRDSQLLLTDSGGIQEEAICLGVPILVAREETERPEVLSSGWGRLVGTDNTRILDELLSPGAWQRRALEGSHANPLGDGYASEAILQILDAAGESEVG